MHLLTLLVFSACWLGSFSLDNKFIEQRTCTGEMFWPYLVVINLDHPYVATELAISATDHTSSISMTC